MIKLLRFLFFVLFLQYNVSAQYADVAWTDAFDLKDTKHLIGNYGDGNNKSTFLFADNSSKASKINIVFVKLNDNSTKVVSHNFENAVTAIIGGYNKPNSFVVIYEIVKENPTGFSFEIKSLEIGEDKSVSEKQLLSYTNTNKLHFGKCKFAQSLDLKKSLLFIEAPFVSGEKENITMIIFDENEKEESKNTVQLDIDSKQNVHNYPQISNNGTVFFLKRDKEKNQHRYFIYSYDPSLKDLKQKQIVLANTNITEIKGQVTAQNEFLVGGFTASVPMHVYEGYYLMKFGADCIQKFKTQGQIDEQTFLRFMSKKEFSKDPAIKDFYLDNIILLESGKIFLAAECYREEAVSKAETWASYKDLMFVCFDANGKYKTTFNYKKNQSMPMINSHWASYRTLPNADTLIIAHNYIVKTEGKKEPEPLLTLVNVHEKYGTKILSTYKLGTQSDTPFFIPDLVYNPTNKQYVCLFADFARTKFRVGIFTQ